jgi:hypothetical protein
MPIEKLLPGVMVIPIDGGMSEAIRMWPLGSGSATFITWFFTSSLSGGAPSGSGTSPCRMTPFMNSPPKTDL